MSSSDAVTFAEAVELARQVGDALHARGWMIATAESCTGGLICHLLTENAGSSVYVAGGAVTYSNAAKQAVLGVRAETLDACGAVSTESAAEMARGALQLYGADIAVAVTGIAGPGGGTAQKPTGTVYLHVARRDGLEQGAHAVWASDRSGNKLLSAVAALRMVQDSTRISS